MSWIRFRTLPANPLAIPAFLLLLAVSAGATWAAAAPAEPWSGAPFAAAPAAVARAAAGITGPPGYDVVMLLNEVSYTYDAAGRETFTQRMVYKILTPGAHESWSAMEEGWAPWHQARPEIRGRVITPDGAEHTLDPATIAENAATPGAPDMFEDGRVLRAPLPATRPGAVVEQQVIVRGTAPFFEGGVVRFHTLDLGVPVQRTRLTLEVPEGTPLRWAARKLPGLTPAETTAGGSRRLVFEARDLMPAEKVEPGLPPEIPRVAYLAFSTGRSWNDLARRYSDIVDQAIRGSDLSSFLRSAGGPAASQLETVNLFLARLGEDVRYTGVELGEGSLIPRKPAETLKRRFGDCKDKAVLLTAMLRASDIPAYVALLNAGEGDKDVEEALPGLGTFNHAIVVVPGTPPVWIDPTDRFARAGELPVADQGRLALIASPTATGLTRTPAAAAAENREVETREFYLAELGPARIVETTDFYGASERSLRAWYAVEDEESLRENLESYASGTYLAEEVSAVEHSKPADLSGPLRLRMEIAGARRGFTDPQNGAVGVNPAALLTRLPNEVTTDPGAGEDDESDEEETATGRQADYVFSRPLLLETRYRIVPPPGYVSRPLPANRVRRFGPVSLSEEYAAGPDQVVTATFRLDTGKRRLSGQEFEEMRRGVVEALEEKISLLMFDQVGEAHLSAGRVREALEEFESLAARQPANALHRSRIARALLAGGMGGAAREEARRAVKLDPKSAIAQRDLGWILQHDELGRRFGAGYDRAGAIAAYRKAKELDPEDEAVRLDLAILLEHDAHGRRYVPEADLAGAIAEYEALREEREDHSGDDNLMVALVRANRFDDAKKLAAEMKESQTANVLGLVATAATEGADAAIRDGERKFNTDTARTAALQQAGQNLMLVRRYGEASVLFDRVGRQSTNAAALLSLAELLKSTRRHEEVALPPDKPASVVKRFVVSLFDADLDVVEFANFFSHDMAAEVLSEDVEAKELKEGLMSFRRSMGSDLPVDTALDLGLSAMREAVSGDDSLGYRLSFSSAMGGSAGQFGAYVVREKGEYRIAGVGSSPEMLAAEALRRLARGDLAGARQWLDWALEEAPEAVAKSGDPVTTSPFSTLWAKGSQAGADEIRCAAAVLKGTEEKDETMPPILAACREAATDPVRRNAFDVALARTWEKLGKPAEMVKVTRRLLDAVPDSERAEDLHNDALIDLDRWDEVRASAERRLQRTAGDAWALHLLAVAAMQAQDFDQAETQLQRLVTSGKATAIDYNDLAWLLLERGRVDEKTLEYSRQAASLSEYGEPMYLHTLASIYAEMGKTAEAYQVILQSLGAKAEEKPGPNDWYVFGRLAEHYGLPDVARNYYKRVLAPDDPRHETLSTHALAARRLAVLDDAKAEGRRAKR